eukprot:scaffold20058_cov72-Isochrysis_galbana.AAC.2
MTWLRIRSASAAAGAGAASPTQPRTVASAVAKREAAAWVSPVRESRLDGEPERKREEAERN